jgi:hypothetical protein
MNDTNTEQTVYLGCPETGRTVCIPPHGSRGCAGYTLEHSYKNHKGATHYGHDGALYLVMTSSEVAEARAMLSRTDTDSICDCGLNSVPAILEGTER